MSSNKDIGFAVVGLGYWGPNILRNAWEIDGLEVVSACDRDPKALAKQAKRYPGIRLDHQIEQVLHDDSIQAVAIVTPISTHYELARRCLLAGKHVLIEKPLAATSEQCKELIALAAERDLILMPGHTFLYSPPVVEVKDLLHRGELGPLYFGTSSRVNLGIHQSDVSVVRDLAPHAFSIFLYWLGQPTFVRAIGRDSIVPGTVDVVFVDMGYSDGTLVHLELSWLAPTKLRRTVLVGTEKMVVYEDTSTEQVRVYDRGVDMMQPENFGEFQLAYRTGDILTPRLNADEPLRVELEDFLDSIRRMREPRSNASLGLDVVRMIEATEMSLAHNCAPVLFDDIIKGRRTVPDRRRAEFGMPVMRPPMFVEPPVA